MATVTAPAGKEAAFPINLVAEDGVPLESDWHRLAMTLLIEMVGLRFQGREDYFVGGNMFIYFNAKQARDRDFRGPDFFLVWDVPLNPPRPFWVVWEEGGKYPDVIIELSSPSTAEEDLGVRKKTYERVFRTNEYFVYNPATETLHGWRLHGKYRAIKPNDQGRLWSDELGVWIGVWKGKYQGKNGLYLRFFDKDGNLISSAEEMAITEREQTAAERQRAQAERQRAEAEREQTAAERQRAEAERQRAEAERQRAEAERQRAEAERQRADAAETELARLKANKK